jgi:Fe-S cluster assembly protein SufD
MAGGRLNMLDRYQTAFDTLPDAFKTPARRAALGQLLAQGFPDTDIEEWKYTDVATPLAGLSLPERLQTEGTRAPDLVAETYTDGLDALNAAFAVEGTRIEVDAGREAVVDAGLAEGGLFGPRFQHRRNRIHLRRGARCAILLRTIAPEIGGSDAALATLFTELILDEGASATVIRVQDDSPARICIERLEARLGRDARLQMVSVDLGGKLVRNDTRVRLEGRGAEARVYGLYAPTGSSHVDNHTLIEHRAPHGTSREVFRGIVGGSARAVFNGKVVVSEGACKTDSEQRVANLLLSPRAEVNAKPELEIYNDDVKCAHGATFGQIDETAVFYLRSRGLSGDAARSLLTYTFAHEVLAHIADETLRREVQQKFIARLPQGELLEQMLLSALPPVEA